MAKNFEFADRVPSIMGRYSDFSQSIMNIVRNALDSMHGCTDKRLSVSTEVKDGDIRITVRDTGCGIRPENRDKIFMPFYTTKPIASQDHGSEPTGTGLGLSTVQRLLSPYGVRFVVDSDVGQGTTFTAAIPISPNTTAARMKSLLSAS